MSEYAIYWALWHHRDIEKYAASQRAKKWKPEEFIDSIHRRIGIMGLGTIGQDTAKKFAMLGFPTAGWSRTAKTLPGVETFHGRERLPKFLGRTNILVNVLPLTRETRGIMDKTLFAALPKGAFVINMGRGGHVVDDDLLAALDSGHLAGAALDVFNVEPLPPEHPYWAHPKVHITPHMAGYTNPRTASPGVIENIKAAARRAAADEHGRREDGVLDVVSHARGEAASACLQRGESLRTRRRHFDCRMPYSAATFDAALMFDRLMRSRLLPSMRTSLVTVSRLGEWMTCTS